MKIIADSGKVRKKKGEPSGSPILSRIVLLFYSANSFYTKITCIPCIRPMFCVFANIFQSPRSTILRTRVIFRKNDIHISFFLLLQRICNFRHIPFLICNDIFIPSLNITSKQSQDNDRYQRSYFLIFFAIQNEIRVNTHTSNNSKHKCSQSSSISKIWCCYHSISRNKRSEKE